MQQLWVRRYNGPANGGAQPDWNLTGMGMPEAVYSDLLPWEIRPEHATERATQPARALTGGCARDGSASLHGGARISVTNWSTADLDRLLSSSFAFELFSVARAMRFRLRRTAGARPSGRSIR